MKKIAVLAGWVIFLFPLSLLTVSLATANTTLNNPDLWAEPAPAAPLEAASVAPDAFGYTYQDEIETSGPTFGFIDISGTGGADLGLGDEVHANIPSAALVGFDFEFYGVPLTDLRVSNNGAILFNTTIGAVGPTNLCLPNGLNNIIAPWWDDWGDGGDVLWQIQGSIPNRRLIVQWNQIVHDKEDGEDEPATFEVILFETSNIILFQYQDTTAGTHIDGTNLDFGNSATISIRGPSAANAQQYGCDAPVLANGRAIRFQRSAITITKDANPSPDPQNFAFTASFTSSTILLDDDADPTLSNTLTFPMLPNSYTVSENLPPPSWGLANLTCASSLAAISGFTGTISISSTNVASRTATISSLAPGDTVACTFINQNFGTIIITKATTPISDTQVFSFTSDIPGNLNFALDTNTGDPTQPISQTFTNLTPGDYFVQEDVLADWDLTDLTCADPSSNTTTNLGTRRADISVAAGETVTCTFTNTKRGTISIEKIVNPANDPQDFSFTASGPTAIADFQLDDDGTAGNPLSDTITLPNLRSGLYTVTETAVAGWNLTNLTCTDPSGGSSGDTATGAASINLAPGETVNCAFTNTKRGIINIIKDSLPNHPQDFTFTVVSSPTSTIPPFSLDDDPPDLTLPVSQTLSVAPGVYTVTEGVVANWSVSGITCVDPTGNTTVNPGARTADINIAPGETVNCTFINQAADANLIVQKATIPGSDPQVFTFTTSVPVTPTFSLDTNGASPTPVSRTLVVSTGIYAVGENGLPDWDLTGTGCSDGSSVNNIDLAPGEIVTCTFTNTKRATIIINKVTSPGPDPQAFDFTSNITGSTNFSLDTAPGGLPNSQNFLVTAGVYTVTEGIVPGWDLSDLTCSAGGSGDTGTRTATITVNPGETVSCTFTNAKLGTITIVKDAVPNHPQDFAFTSDIPGNAAFSLDDDADATLPFSRTFISLAAGTYTVTESIVANWSVSNINCLDPTGNSTGDTGTRTATINVAPGETVTCTFTNTAAPGTIIIQKTAVANPANDPQDFSFTAAGPTVILPFQLDDDGVASNPLSDTITLGNLTPGTYTVTEGPVAGWDLTGLSCNDADSTGNIGTGAATIIVAPAETVQCTFTNTKRGTIVINKATNPASDPQDFAFSSTITGSTSFSLDTDAGDATLPNSQTFTTPPGAYSVTEQAVTGWDLTALNCVDSVGGGSSGNLGTRTASINVSAGETVTCTFTNTAQPGIITITKNAIPNDPQDFGYVLTGVSTNTIFSLDDDGNPTLPNSRTFTGLAHGIYNVIEGATSGWALTGLTCTDPTGNTTTNPGFGLATIALGAGETVNCTFTNTFNNTVGSITIVKSAVPTSTQSFTFTSSIPGNTSFSLVDDGTPPNSQSFLNLNPGSYSVTELGLAGWSLTDLTCTDPDGGSTVSLGTRTATIDVDAAENVTCTFSNTVVTGTTGILYLPIIMTELPTPADLTITNFTVTGSNPNHVVTVVVQNQGSISTGEGFWVDFYVNPTTLPNDPSLGGDRRWNVIGSSQGIAWQVPPLAGGQSVTLTSDGSVGIGPSGPQTSWNGSLPAGSNNLYAFADSFDLENAPFVEIDESNENNNMAGPLVVIATAGSDGDSAGLTDPSEIPPRWDP